MDQDTRIILIAVCGGMLGWAIGNLLDIYISKYKLKKNKLILGVVAVSMMLLIFYLKMKRLPLGMEEWR